MLAENLKKIRKDKGYTQEILAEKLNVVRQTVSKWEKGLSLPDVDMLSKIANVLETDVNILLDGQITTTDQSEIVKQLAKIIYVFLTIFLYLLKCPQSLILSALRAFCLCGKPHISRLIFLYFPCQSWLKSW